MNIISLNLTEIKRLKLTINEYLTLLCLNGTIEYKYVQEDLNKLVELKFVNRLGNIYVLSAKAVEYFQANTEFEEFFNTFPHTVSDGMSERPLRTASLDTQGAAVTKSIWKKKVRGNKELHNKIIQILEAEIQWRTETNQLKYMNNIDTWLRQNNWEKYEYLLNNNNHFNNRI